MHVTSSYRVKNVNFSYSWNVTQPLERVNIQQEMIKFELYHWSHGTVVVQLRKWNQSLWISRYCRFTTSIVEITLIESFKVCTPYIPTCFITLIVPQSITMLLFCQKSFSTFTFTFICLGSPTDRTHKRISSLFCYGKTIKYPCRLRVKGNVIVNCHRQNEKFQWIRTGKGNATRYYLRITFMTMYNESMN